MTALRALLGGIVDYAGLFPPAALDMPAAVQSYVEYRASDESWMLGRFVAPAARLPQLDAALQSVGRTGTDLTVSAVAGDDIVADGSKVVAFNALAPEGRRVDTVEVRLSTRRSIADAASVARDGFSVFAEIPVAEDPAALIDAIAGAELNAKIRTGGVTVDAFPRAAQVVRFMTRCIHAGVPFKATAGLHHPLCGEYALTYAADVPRGAMFGFLNVFLTAAALRQGASEEDAVALLGERDPGAFTVTTDAVSWRGARLTTEALSETREQSAVAFGSCSFREPVNELRALGYPA